ncbi:T9SS type A sorting domain-containing protein [Flammeovirga agarivorans]|uniref:T9SS type A sorting domain-containing protein n=1 Tax=Flammeovirga agarivorans TaxID=2726742 RepID=A0A7X8SND7_9BACT|nr:T9SS type A sorting domain-containing protein [Flammeovirga agarivorans]NLR93405.1 T9SS type A sorting domain-containing protein [Flammeovirga agarivorans]
MKKTLIFIALQLQVIFAIAQTPLNFDTEILSSGNYIVGVPYEVSSVGATNQIKINCKATGTEAKFGVYADDEGAPGELIFHSNTITLTEDEVMVSLENTVLEPGKYWIMVNYKSNGYHVNANVSDPLSKVYYTQQRFSESFPVSAAEFDLYYGHQFPFSIEVIEKPKSFEMEVYPNPTVDDVHIQANQKEYMVHVYDSQAKKVLSQFCQNYKTELELKTLQKGTYYIVIEGEETFRILKN